MELLTYIKHAGVGNGFCLRGVLDTLAWVIGLVRSMTPAMAPLRRLSRDLLLRLSIVCLNLRVNLSLSLSLNLDFKLICWQRHAGRSHARAVIAVKVAEQADTQPHSQRDAGNCS